MNAELETADKLTKCFLDHIERMEFSPERRAGVRCGIGDAATICTEVAKVIRLSGRKSKKRTELADVADRCSAMIMAYYNRVRVQPAAVAALLLALLPSVAVAQVREPPKCWPYKTAVAGLREKYGETPLVQALTTGGNMVVFFANAERSTWTSLLVTAAGLACKLDDGKHIELVTPPQPGQPS